VPEESGVSQQTATREPVPAAPGPGPGRRRRIILLAAVFVALLASISGVVVACTNSTPDTPPTVRVDRGPVKLAVSASGTVSPGGRHGIGFADGGQVTEVLVKVGDQVTVGQTIARVDDTVARQTLAQREAGLAQQAAVLAKLRGGTAVGDSRAALDQARRIEQATREQVEATNDANESATSRARVQLRFDEDQVRRAEARLRTDRAACRASTATPAAAAVRTTTVTVTVAPTAPSTATGTPVATATTPPTTTASVVRMAATTVTGADTGTGTGTGTTAACQQAASSETAVQQARGTVVGSRTALETAEQRERTDAASGQVSIENARQSVLSAQASLNTASNDRPADIAAQEAVVDDARAAVEIAREDLAQTVLTAPVAGTVTALNGTVGEIVAAPSAATPQAPGSDGPLPLATGGTGTGSAGATTPGAGAFAELDASDAFQVVVPFEETDAARIQPGQLVDVTVDALGDPPLTGRVVSIAPSGEELSGIVSYYTTVIIEGGAGRLRAGQTAEAAVTVDAVDDVLRVPASAVGRSGGRPAVTLTGPDGRSVTQTFLPGLVGDDYVEVRSGLADGEEVRLPQATVTAEPDRGPPGGD
jgi:HlyD family secretion protein